MRARKRDRERRDRERALPRPARASASPDGSPIAANTVGTAGKRSAKRRARRRRQPLHPERHRHEQQREQPQRGGEAHVRAFDRCREDSPLREREQPVFVGAHGHVGDVQPPQVGGELVTAAPLELLEARPHPRRRRVDFDAAPALGVNQRDPPNRRKRRLARVMHLHRKQAMARGDRGQRPRAHSFWSRKSETRATRPGRLVSVSRRSSAPASAPGVGLAVAADAGREQALDSDDARASSRAARARSALRRRTRPLRRCRRA